MNVLQKQQVVKIFNRLFNEADTTNMPAKRIEEISEAIDLVKNLHIPDVGVTLVCKCGVETVDGDWRKKCYTEYYKEED